MGDHEEMKLPDDHKPRYFKPRDFEGEARLELEEQWKQPAYDPSKPQKATKLKGGTE